MSRELNNAATSLAYQMREQIRELQEKRAAAMMNEITELQRERDVALNKVKQMDKAVSDLHKENELLKKNCDNEAELKLENKHLKQSLLEETLISSNLRKKLKNMERKPIQESSPLFQHTKAIIRLTNEESNLKTKSQSISDLTNTSSLQIGISPAQSPSVVTRRRYKLAHITTNNQETQTDTNGGVQAAVNMKGLPPHVIDALTDARNDLLQIQEQNEDLHEKIKKHAIEKEKYETQSSQLKTLQDECEGLKESLKQFSQWAQHKIASVEEEMDICKVVYSLQGSLSEETKIIEELKEKTISNESVINHLTLENE
jgi:hypothetical protein